MQSELDYMWNEVLRRRAEEDVLIEYVNVAREEHDKARAAWHAEFAPRPCSDEEQVLWDAYQTRIAAMNGARNELLNASKRLDEAISRYDLFRTTGLVAA